MLETPRLLLRPPEPGDVDALAAIFSDPEVMKFIGDGSTRSREQVAAAVEEHRASILATGLGAFTIVRKDTGEVCGDAVLVKIPPSGVDWRNSGVRSEEVEVGYRLGQAHWGEGIATEAASALLEHAFHTLGLRRVIAVTHPENKASQRVLEKCGMDEVGLTEDYYDAQSLLFEMVRPDLL